jgi:hypothetical protein
VPRRWRSPRCARNAPSAGERHAGDLQDVPVYLDEIGRKSNLAQQQAVLELAKVQFDRDAAIISNQGNFKARLDTKKNAVAVGEAQVQFAEPQR